MCVHTVKEASGQDIKGHDAIPVVTEEVRKKRKYTKRAKVPAVNTRAPGSVDVCEDGNRVANSGSEVTSW